MVMRGYVNKNLIFKNYAIQNFFILIRDDA